MPRKKTSPLGVEDAPAKKQRRKGCSAEGCSNIAVGGGVCNKHGATEKLCSNDGCTNKAIKGGVCHRHGAKRKNCSSDGCTNQVVKGGVCHRHGAKVKKCSHSGCTSFAKIGGICIRHGAKVKKCSHSGCTSFAKKGGVCKTHGAEVKICNHEDCPNKVHQGGVCKRHREVPSKERVSEKYQLVSLSRATMKELNELHIPKNAKADILFNCSASVYEKLSEEEQQRLKFKQFSNGECYTDSCRTQRKIPPSDMPKLLEHTIQGALNKPDISLHKGNAITTAPGAKRQQCHTDYDEQVMESGEASFVIVPLGKERQSIIVKDGNNLRRVHLIPRNAFIGRGDLEHAGSEDQGTRLHFEFIPERFYSTAEASTYFVEDKTYPDCPL